MLICVARAFTTPQTTRGGCLLLAKQHSTRLPTAQKSAKINFHHKRDFKKMAKLFLFIIEIVLISVSFTYGESNNSNLEIDKFRYYNIGVLMASRLDSPFDLERCGPAVDLALEEVNDKFLMQHGIQLRKVQARYEQLFSFTYSCKSGIQLDHEIYKKIKDSVTMEMPSDRGCRNLNKIHVTVK